MFLASLSLCAWPRLFQELCLLNDFEVALLITACSFLNDDSPALSGTSFHPAAF